METLFEAFGHLFVVICLLQFPHFTLRVICVHRTAAIATVIGAEVKPGLHNSGLVNFHENSQRPIMNILFLTARWLVHNSTNRKRWEFLGKFTRFVIVEPGNLPIGPIACNAMDVDTLRYQRSEWHRNLTRSSSRIALLNEGTIRVWCTELFGLICAPPLRVGIWSPP